MSREETVDPRAGFSTLDAAAVRTYERDGAICLRGALGPQWLAAIAEGIETDRRSPGRFFRDQTPASSPAKYVFSYWIWRDNAPFRRVIFDSPAGGIAARILGAERVTMIMDNWFLREAGATNGAPWHHDEPYFDFDGGRMCAIWIPLEPATPDEGLTFVAGSHRWGKLFMPLNFRDRIPFEGVAGEGGYAPVPDIDAVPGAYEFLSWEMAAGDCLIFDLRTLHEATAGTKPLQRTIRRLSLRFADQDVRFKPRGPWTEEISKFLIDEGQAAGGLLDCPMLPVVWQRAA
ncbi:MAG: phytanoyl-CoA dioxygenase family protein [Methylobacteriaceae bacterium]|nr:phytanoyl-CoA dioxygenase family protein [Methylobacteriaceae bacterium]